jgi:diguanylate cyclase (GGDEF)-like protein
MSPTLQPQILGPALVLVAAGLIALACRWRPPRADAGIQSHARSGAWLVGNALLAAGAVSALRGALGFAVGDSPMEPLLGILGWSELIALVAVGLLVWFGQAHTSRGLRMLGAALAALAIASTAAAFETLGLPLWPSAAVASVAAATLAPLLMSISSRAILIAHVRDAAASASGDHLLIVDSLGRLLHATEPTCKALGLTGVASSGRELPAALQQLVRSGETRRATLRTKSGRVLEAWATAQVGTTRGLLVRDVTDRHRDERRLVRLAHYDSLTGLPNRRLFLETLAKVLQQANGSASPTALFYIDLDDFKTINDSLGHGAGDMLLETLAERFRTELRIENLTQVGGLREPLSIARLSGDEFAVIAPQLPDSQTAQDLASQILEVIGRPIELSDRTLTPSASIGIALFPDDGRDLDTLIRHADTALYAAKSQGRRRYTRYEASFDEKADRARLLESGLRDAIERDELRLFYQPKVEAKTGAVVGFEALMRWKSPELGDVGPAEFIPVAEDRGLIPKLGTWSLREACRQQREWADAGLAIVPVAVNVSSHQFTQADLQSEVSNALRDHQIEPRHLELELTERLLLDEDSNAEQVLRDLRAIGLRIALDDFGTGYSALTYLSRFSLDVLKMDRGLLRDIDSNPSARGIASAVISMAHSLDLCVVAEGVDCEEQTQILRHLNCDQIQGFLYSPALPPDDVLRFMAKSGDAAPVIEPMSGHPGARPASEAQVQDDAPVMRNPGDLEVRAEPVDADKLRRRGRVLIIDEQGDLGLAVMRLSRLGIDIHHAARADEARLLIAQEGHCIRAIAGPPNIDLRCLLDARDQLAEISGDSRRMIVIGERPTQDVQEAIREAGVDWVLWAPFNDTELRCLVKSAMTLPHEVADRREPRVPVDMVASLAFGATREIAVVSSLSAHGAFIETNDPRPVGSTMRIELDLLQDRFRGFARVVHAQEDDPDNPHEPSGMGVSFFGSDRDTERILRKAVSELGARYLP